MPRTKEKLTDALAAANGARPTTARCPFCGVDVRIRSDRKLSRHPAIGQGRGGEACAGSSLPEDALHDVAEEAAAVLDDRLATAPPSGLSGGLIEVPLDRLDADPGNPRGEVTPDGALDELAASIASLGVLQPLMVVPGPADRYTIVFGHRRAAAARSAGLTTVAAIIRPDLVDATDRILAAQLVENLQRSDLDPMAEARGFARLRELGLTQTDIASAVGINQGTVSKRLSLLKLPEEVQSHVGVDLEPSVAVELARLEPEVATKAAAEITAGRPPEVVIREAGRVAQEKNLAAATIDRLEALGTAVVEWPRWGAWGPEREDLPLSDQPEGVACTAPSKVAVSADDHATLPCHGAAVQPQSGAAAYVCLDPSRHGVESPAVAAERRRAEGQEAAARAEDARVAREAALQRRHEATVAAARVKASKGDLLGYVATWTCAAVAGVTDVAGWEPTAAPGPNDVLSIGDLLEPDVEVCERSSWGALVDEHGTARAAYAACLAAGARYLEHVEGGGRRHRGSLAVLLHLDRLVSAAGYELTDDDRAHLVEPSPVASPDAPADAVGWYEGTDPDADPGRWITDGGEAEVIADLHPELWTPAENGAGEQLDTEVEVPTPPAERVRCEGSGAVIITAKGTPAKPRKPAPCATCGQEFTVDRLGRAPRHTRPVA